MGSNTRRIDACMEDNIKGVNKEVVCWGGAESMYVTQNIYQGVL